MLVLTRKVGETVQIGSSIVEVLEIHGSRIRLGITAAADVDIVRGELLGSEGQDLRGLFDLVEA